MSTSTIPEDSLGFSSEAVSFGPGERKTGEKGVSPPAQSLASSSPASTAFSPAGGGGTERAAVSNANRRRFSSGPAGRQQQDGGGGGGGTAGGGRPRVARTARHSVSGSLGGNVNQKKYDKDTSTDESSNDGFIPAGEIVPTALVIKNISFSVKRDQFLSMMESEGIQKPSAFNYHYENGLFRGLAFANYMTPEETDVVVAQLNGKELGGRKLRAEHKRAPPNGQSEKDRRLSVRTVENSAGNAAATLKAVEEGGEGVEQPPPNMAQRRESKPGQQGWHQRTKSRSDNDHDWRDSHGHHLPPSQGQFQHYHHNHQNQHQQIQHQRPRDGEDSGAAGENIEYTQGELGVPQRDNGHARDGSAGSVQRRQSRAEEDLDLEDPETRSYYEMIRAWKHERPKSPVLEFPPILTPEQQKILYRISGKLGLYHFSENDGAERRICIMRSRPRIDKNVTCTPQRSSAGIQASRSCKSADASRSSASSEGLGLSKSPGGSALARSPMIRPSFKYPESTQLNFGPVRQPRGPHMPNNFAARRTQLPSGDSKAGSSSDPAPAVASKLKLAAAPSVSAPPSNPSSSGNSPLLQEIALSPSSSSASALAAVAAGGPSSNGVGSKAKKQLDANAPSFLPNL